jgi:hypothetical protein
MSPNLIKTMTIPIVVPGAKHGVLHLSSAANYRVFFWPRQCGLSELPHGSGLQRKSSPLVDLLSLHLGLHRTKHRTVHTLASSGEELRDRLDSNVTTGAPVRIFLNALLKGPTSPVVHFVPILVLKRIDSPKSIHHGRRFRRIWRFLRPRPTRSCTTHANILMHHTISCKEHTTLSREERISRAADSIPTGVADRTCGWVKVKASGKCKCK